NHLPFVIASTTAAFATTTLFSIDNKGLASHINILATGSSTLQNFTALNSTSTSATSTNFFSTTASSTNLYSTSANLGTLTLGGALAITNGGTGLSSITGNRLLYSDPTGANLLEVATSSLNIGGNAATATILQTARTINGTSFNGSSNITITAASSTLLANNNTFTGSNSFNGILSTASSTLGGGTQASGVTIAGGATTTGYLVVQGTAATSTFASGVQATYLNVTGTSATSTFARGVDLSGGCFAINGTCIGSGAGSGTVTSIVAGTGLSGGTITTTGTISLNLGNANTWTALQQFQGSASSTLFSAGRAYFGETATSSFTADGSLGIGTTVPYSKLHVGNVSTVGNPTVGVLTNNSSTFGNSVLPSINITATSSTNTQSSYIAAVGLNMHNDATAATSTRTPALTFSQKSYNGVYASTIAAVDAVYLGHGGDGSWGGGALAFHTAPLLGFGPQERMRIDSSGNVGIGTTTPASKLDVSGGMMRVMGYAVPSPATGAGAEIFYTGGEAYFHGYNRDTGAYLPIDLVGSTVALKYGASTGLFLNASGNVGIGTTSPYRRLSVKDTVSAAQSVIAYDDTRYTELQTDASGDFILNPSGDDTFLNADNL
ncbi:MAG: hypothetical protein AAB597_01790, partial [Patescibacteria group bacterium]